MSKRTKPKKGKWLRRSLMTGPCFRLFLQESEFLREMRRLGIKDQPHFVRDGGGSTHSFVHEGKPVSLVTIDREACDRYSMTEVAGILVHEAVHVWQAYCHHIGEDKPSDEFEAYSIQHIAQQLIVSFREQIGEPA